MSDLMHWGNYRTGEDDFRDEPKTDAEAADYLPQNRAAQGLYAVCRAKGETVMESIRLVLTACVGEKADQ